MANYLALHTCIATSPDWASYPATKTQLTTFANELIGVLQDTVSIPGIWDSIVDNRAADWDLKSDLERETIRTTLSFYRNDGIATAAGNAPRDLLVSVFGGGSATITDMLAKFTVDTRRAETFGWGNEDIGEADIDEAVRLYGGP